ncbi:hypothetical protein, variant [Puccinia triticina 1-1 BBBD Race 1]|uniref:Methionine adenosyltransferase 2 subunit beta n=1 Tax=Puccinia triticina (isolate 1-1 / race 1 (BBBD)) TaxID=630390 RepID=A0A0C4EPA6_PUCT1|nr:hypothetical protein PTTG_02607 [Puccinia triticina 1-1 BBBD Race 1]OAV90524.1 hypothetical protein, variant [Puccinia triticina 1-1 BBBD Race 1]
MKMLISGGSGLLGRAVVDLFRHKGDEPHHQVTSLSFTRSGPGLQKVDLRDEQLVSTLVHDLKPDVMIHCAAERRPDVAERDPEGTQKLNVRVTEHLAELSNQVGFKLIYICTDYVFDGNAPPGGYDVEATPNPTNLYGKTKLAGEQALLRTVTKKGNAVSLRVPVLYGKAEGNNESAINVLLDGVNKAAKGQKVLMDDWATRFPTLVDDVAKVLVAIAEYKDPLPPILHFSSEQQYTKYTISLVFAKLLKLSESETKNLVPQPDPPKPAQGETMRPRDCRLSNQALVSLGICVQQADFVDWWTAYLNSQ